MRNFLTLYKIEQRMFFRSIDVIIFNLCMPVVALILIASIAGSKSAGDITFLQSSFASLITVGICCSAFMSIPIVMVDYRDKKVLKSFYCSPCSPLRILSADTLCSAVMSALSAILVTIVAVVVFGYRMQGNIICFILAWLLTMISMFSIGLLIASLCRTAKSMSVATSLVYFPMLLLSGAIIPYELFPTFIRRASDVMPLTLGIKLMKTISTGGIISSSETLNIIILLAITVVCAIVSVKTFRWE